MIELSPEIILCMRAMLTVAAIASVCIAIKRGQRWRFGKWIAATASMFALISWVAPAQVLLNVHALSRLTLAAVVGYMLDRAAFQDRVSANSSDMRRLCRALLMAAAMIAAALVS